MNKCQDKIILADLQFYAYHGVEPEEQSLGQRFVVDIELYGDFRKAGISDQLEQAVDYSAVYQIVRGIVEGTRFRLIEALAERIAGVLLGEFSITEVLVRIKKPQVPLPGILAYAGVEIKRRRS